MPFDAGGAKEAVNKNVDPKEALRGVSWSLGYRGSEPGKTEQQIQYVKQNGGPNIGNEEELKARLRKPNIHLAYGQASGCETWMAVQTEEFSRAEDAKYECKPPADSAERIAELRCSKVSFDLPGGHGPRTSEQKSRFIDHQNADQVVNFAETLGKDLRASHIDIANGGVKSTDQWRGVGGEEMSRHAKDKFQCEKPSGFEALSKELRKSSVPLGTLGDKV